MMSPLRQCAEAYALLGLLGECSFRQKRSATSQLHSYFVRRLDSALLNLMRFCDKAVSHSHVKIIYHAK
jgi:hypothetical protein